MELNNAGFYHYVKQFELKVERHKVDKDKASAKAAALAYGRMEGFFIAFNQPKEWLEEVTRLKGLYIKYVL